MQKVFIIRTDEGYVIAEATNYTYDSEEGARAFAKDKWGDENPSGAVAIRSAPYRQTKVDEGPGTEGGPYNRHTKW